MRSKTAVETGSDFGGLGADHVDDGSGGLGEFGYVFGRDEAGVVGAVGEDDDGFAAGEAGGVFYGEQKAVVEGGVVAGDGVANAAQDLGTVRGEGGDAGEIAAVGVERDLADAFERADEVGDGVLGEDESAIHVVAGVEEDEDVGAGETFADVAGVGIGRRPCRRHRSRRCYWRPRRSRMLRVGPFPSSKVACLFGNLVFGDGEVFGA